MMVSTSPFSNDYEDFFDIIHDFEGNTDNDAELSEKLNTVYIRLCRSLQRHPKQFPNKGELLLDLSFRLGKLKHVYEERFGTNQLPRTSIIDQNKEGLPTTNHLLIKGNYIKKAIEHIDGVSRLLQSMPSSDISFATNVNSPDNPTIDDPLRFFNHLINFDSLQDALKKFRHLDGSQENDGSTISYSELDRTLSVPTPTDEDEPQEVKFEDYLSKLLQEHSHKSLSLIIEKANSLTNNESAVSVYINQILSLLVKKVESVEDLIDNKQEPLKEGSQGAYWPKRIAYDNYIGDRKMIAGTLRKMIQVIISSFGDKVSTPVKDELKRLLGIEVVNDQQTQQRFLIWKDNADFFNAFTPLIYHDSLSDESGKNTHEAIIEVLTSIFKVPQKRNKSDYYEVTTISTMLTNKVLELRKAEEKKRNEERRQQVDGSRKK